MARGQKICPSCSKTMGPRTLTCVCGYDFGITKPLKFDNVPANETIAQAIERVKNAKVKAVSKVATKIRKPRSKTVDNHKILAPGDKIKITGGGPYVVNKDGDKIRMGYKGRFVVKGVDQNGIFAYGNKKEGEQSMCYIWMGRNLLTKAGVHRRAHKVMKVA